MTADRPGSSLDDLDSRLRDLRGRVEGRKIEPEAEASQGLMKGLGMAWRVASELVAAFAVGVGFGWLVDRWLDSGPFGLIAGFFLGAAAGALNVYRAAMGLGLAAGYRPTDSGRERKDGSAGGGAGVKEDME